MPATLRSSKKPPRGPTGKPSSSNNNNNHSSPQQPPEDALFDASLGETLKSINHAQALEQNVATLRTLGGAPALAKLLRTDPHRGVDVDTVEARRAAFGPNELPVTPRKSFWELFAGTFEDATLQILIVSAVVSLAIGLYDDPATGYVEGVAILAAVLVVSVVTAGNDYQKESQFRELSAVNNEKDVVVIRGGIHWQIPIQDIVVGDVVCMESGDQVPCDGVLTLANAVEVDESALTGEAVDVYKDLDADPFLLSGCVLEAGSCQFLAIAVGKQSQWGIIQSHLDAEQEQTPLQQKLDDMAANIGYVGMAAAGATFLAMMFIKLVLDPEYVRDVSVFAYALEAFIIGVTIVVVAVPEGLPLAVTISLAFSTKKMLADQNLIRHLAACETMGNATNILSDKTGTLTENRMTVVKGVFADTICEDTVHRVPMLVSTKAFHYLLEGIACCSTARVTYDDVEDEALLPAAAADPAPPTVAVAGRTSPATLHVRKPSSDLHHAVRRPSWDQPRRPSFSDHPVTSAAAAAAKAASRGRPHIIGNKTEASLLILAQSAWSHYDHADERREEARFGLPGGSRLFPFSSKRKRMSVLVTKPDLSGNNEWTLYHKGAAEVVLAACSFYLDIDGSEKPMTKEKRAEFASIIGQFATDALRCVALAHRRNVQALVNPNTCSADDVERKLEKDMCLDAIAGIMDPLREDVLDAVATCQRAGIVVRMVTGDNLDTAKAIARKAGILTDDGICMAGEDFRKLTPAGLDAILPRLQVLARSSPEDKHILVQRLNGGLLPSTKEEWLEAHPGCDFEKLHDKLLPGFKEEWAASRGGVGEVVGVTGDGTNDGPALKAADVGLSMGLSGTDVAKKASDIIIMDDRFSSVVKAVLWGRSVFDNIRKFLQFQLTVNVVALTITFLAAVVGYQPPLNAVMMLWVNLIMDTMGALALGTEPPRLELLDRRPYKRDASLISRPMWRNILCQATYQLLILVFLLNKGPQMFQCEDGSRHHFTILFNAFVFCQVFNEFNAREIGDRFDPIRSMSQSPMFLMVIFFTVFAQWVIVEYGGDFTQTYPLSWQEWRITVGMGAMSLPVGFFMRLIPVREDPATFAGMGPPAAKEARGWNVLALLLAVLVPVFVGIVYQLYWEIDEFTEHS